MIQLSNIIKTFIHDKNSGCTCHRVVICHWRRYNMDILDRFDKFAIWVHICRTPFMIWYGKVPTLESFIRVCVTLIFWLCVWPIIMHLVYQLICMSDCIPVRCYSLVVSYLETTENIVLEPLVILILSPQHDVFCDPTQILWLANRNIDGVLRITVLLLSRCLYTYPWLQILNLWPHLWSLPVVSMFTHKELLVLLLHIMLGISCYIGQRVVLYFLPTCDNYYTTIVPSTSCMYTSLDHYSDVSIIFSLSLSASMTRSTLLYLVDNNYGGIVVAHTGSGITIVHVFVRR